MKKQNNLMKSALSISGALVFAVALVAFAAFNDFPNTSAAGGLIAHWDFEPNNVSGNTVMDTSGNGNHGTNFGASISNGCAFFDGVDDKINVPNFDRQVFSFAGWVQKQDGGKTTPTIMASFGNFGWGVGFGHWIPPDHTVPVGATGPQKIMFTHIDKSWINSTNVVYPNQMNHIAVTYDGSNARFYINGSLDNVQSYPRTFNSGGQHYELGFRTYQHGSHFDSPLKGFLADIQVYDYVLSSSQVAALAQDVQSCDAPQPVACHTNSDCGTNGFIGSNFCQNNDVYQQFKTWTCVNPGTAQSFCSSSTAPQLKQQCNQNQQCSSGSCQNITYQCSDGIDNDNDGATDYPNDFSCSSPTDDDETFPKAQCQDGFDNDNDNLIDYPQDPGCISKQDNDEFNQTQFVCNANSDCGTNGFIGSNFCQNNDVYQQFKTWTCVNPGTAQSFCSSSTAPQLKQQCNQNQQCSSGSCIGSQLNVSCSASPNPANTNQQVTFTSNVSGGTGNYNYMWTGACNGFFQNCQKSFLSPGTYNAFLQVTSGNQARNTSCPVTVGQFCFPNNHKQCVGNSVYWFDSCGNQGNLSQQCSVNQTCSGGSCVDTPVCLAPAYKQCIGNAVYLVDACTNQKTLVEQCSASQICSGSSCINKGTGAVTFSLNKEARNISGGAVGWSNTINAQPSDIIEFRVTVTPSGTGQANIVTLKDTLPQNLTYIGQLALNGAPYTGNITSGVVIDGMVGNQPRVVTYRAQVAPAANFAFGATQLVNSVLATSVNAQPVSASAYIIVARTGILGATFVPTGLTNNSLLDYLVIPLVLILTMLWLMRTRIRNGVRWAYGKWALR